MTRQREKSRSLSRFEEGEARGVFRRSFSASAASSTRRLLSASSFSSSSLSLSLLVSTCETNTGLVHMYVYMSIRVSVRACMPQWYICRWMWVAICVSAGLGIFIFLRCLDRIFFRLSGAVLPPCVVSFLSIPLASFCALCLSCLGSFCLCL